MGPSLAYNARIVGRTNLTDTLSTFLIQLDQPPQNHPWFTAGQYCVLGLDNSERPDLGSVRRAMSIAYDEAHLEGYVREAVLASPEHPILVDRFLEDAYEVDVDAVGDGERVIIGGILQHIEEAGIHSGDSAMVLPTYKISAPHLDTIRRYTRRLGEALQVRGRAVRLVWDRLHSRSVQPDQAAGDPGEEGG